MEPGWKLLLCLITIGASGTYPNIAAALPFLTYGDNVVFVSDVDETPGIVIDKNISINGMGYTWLFNSSIIQNQIFILDRPTHPTSVSIRNASIYLFGAANNFVWTNVSDLLFEDILVDSYDIASCYFFNRFINAVSYTGSQNIYVRNINISNPLATSISLTANGSASIYFEGTNIIANNSLMFYPPGQAPDFVRLMTYNDSIAELVLSHIYEWF